MKKQIIVMFFLLLGLGSTMFAQDYTNFISCEVDGKEWKAEAKKLRIPISGFEYLAIAAFQVSPDIQVWIRMYYFTDELKPGTYEITSEKEIESNSKKKNKKEDMVWVLVDYTEETKGLGHAFHDGESMSGSLTIEEITPTSVKGFFEATLNGVYYKKRAVATMTGSGIRGNLEKKLITKAGGGMLANGDPHYHENTKKSNETDTIVLTNGKFFVDWSKQKKEEETEE